MGCNVSSKLMVKPEKSECSLTIMSMLLYKGE